MSHRNILVALVAAAGLAACSTAPADPMVALLDSAGTALTSVPASSVANVPPGTAMRIDVNGRQETVTVGPRVSPGTSAGTAVVGQTRGDGSPVITHVGPGRGNLAPGGTPYFEDGRISRDGRPHVAYDTTPR